MNRTPLQLKNMSPGGITGEESGLDLRNLPNNVSRSQKQANQQSRNIRIRGCLPERLG